MDSFILKPFTGKRNLSLHPSDQWIPVGIGNHYKGEWNHRTMSGNGIYVMLDGNHLSVVEKKKKNKR